MFAQSAKLFVTSHFVSFGSVVVAGAAAGVVAFSVLLNTAPAPGAAVSSGVSRQAATIRQEELKDRWLAHGTNFSGAAYSVERQEALKEAKLALVNTDNRAKVAAIQKQEELKDAWLTHAKPVAVPYSVERQEALKDAKLASSLQDNRAKVAAIQQQEALKDAWLTHDRPVLTAYSVERQEALKDTWLAR